MVKVSDGPINSRSQSRRNCYCSGYCEVPVLTAVELMLSPDLRFQNQYLNLMTNHKLVVPPVFSVVNQQLHHHYYTIFDLWIINLTRWINRYGKGLRWTVYSPQSNYITVTVSGLSEVPVFSD